MARRSSDVKRVKVNNKKLKRKKHEEEKKKLANPKSIKYFDKLRNLGYYKNKTRTVVTKSKHNLNESAKSKIKTEKIQKRKSESLEAKAPEAEEKTVYVGNVHVLVKRKAIKRFFEKYGEVDSVRIRGVTAEDTSTSKKVALLKGKIHSNRSTVIAYVRFKNVKDKEAALAANGQLLYDLHISVNNAVSEEKKLPHSIFVGNLAWEIQDEDLWTLFKDCGPMENVRIVRSAETGACKGFGYVAFKDAGSIELALLLNEREIRKRPVRIQRIIRKPKTKKNAKSKLIKSGVSSLLQKKKVTKPSASFMTQDKPQKSLIENNEKSTEQSIEFTGEKSSSKKNKLKKDSTTVAKKKKSKSDINKRKIAKILKTKIKK